MGILKAAGGDDAGLDRLVQMLAGKDALGAGRKVEHGGDRTRWPGPAKPGP